MKPVVIIGLSVGCSVIAVLGVLAITGAFAIWQAEMAIEDEAKYQKTLEIFVEMGYLCENQNKYADQATCKANNYNDALAYMISKDRGEDFDLFVQLYADSLCFHHPQNNQWYCGKTWF